MSDELFGFGVPEGENKQSDFETFEKVYPRDHELLNLTGLDIEFGGYSRGEISIAEVRREVWDNRQIKLAEKDVRIKELEEKLDLIEKSPCDYHHACIEGFEEKEYELKQRLKEAEEFVISCSKSDWDITRMQKANAYINKYKG